MVNVEKIKQVSAKNGNVDVEVRVPYFGGVQGYTWEHERVDAEDFFSRLKKYYERTPSLKSVLKKQLLYLCGKSGICRFSEGYGALWGGSFEKGALSTVLGVQRCHDPRFSNSEF